MVFLVKSAILFIILEILSEISACGLELECRACIEQKCRFFNDKDGRFFCVSRIQHPMRPRTIFKLTECAQLQRKEAPTPVPGIPLNRELTTSARPPVFPSPATKSLELQRRTSPLVQKQVENLPKIVSNVSPFTRLPYFGAAASVPPTQSPAVPLPSRSLHVDLSKVETKPKRTTVYAIPTTSPRQSSVLPFDPKPQERHSRTRPIIQKQKENLPRIVPNAFPVTRLPYFRTATTVPPTQNSAKPLPLLQMDLPKVETESNKPMVYTLPTMSPRQSSVLPVDPKPQGLTTERPAVTSQAAPTAATANVHYSTRSNMDLATVGQAVLQTQAATTRTSTDEPSVALKSGPPTFPSSNLTINSNTTDLVSTPSLNPIESEKLQLMKTVPGLEQIHGQLFFKGANLGLSAKNSNASFLSRLLRSLCWNYTLLGKYLVNELDSNYTTASVDRILLKANPVSNYPDLCFQLTGRRRMSEPK